MLATPREKALPKLTSYWYVVTHIEILLKLERREMTPDGQNKRSEPHPKGALHVLSLIPKINRFPLCALAYAGHFMAELESHKEIEQETINSKETISSSVIVLYVLIGTQYGRFSPRFGLETLKQGKTRVYFSQKGDRLYPRYAL